MTKQAQTTVQKYKDTNAVIIMLNLLENAESPNKPLINWPELWFLGYMGFVEFGLSISLIVVFIYRLFCL